MWTNLLPLHMMQQRPNPRGRRRIHGCRLLDEVDTEHKVALPWFRKLHDLLGLFQALGSSNTHPLAPPTSQPQSEPACSQPGSRQHWGDLNPSGVTAWLWMVILQRWDQWAFLSLFFYPLKSLPPPKTLPQESWEKRFSPGRRQRSRMVNKSERRCEIPPFS